jgi:hypothetical protein
MDITFCPHCRQQVEPHLLDAHDCPRKPDDYEGPPGVTVTLNRKQRRQAMARAKNRIRKEKGR